MAAFFFGGWTQFGTGTDPAPWFWINQGFAGRLPTRSVALPGHWLGWTFNANDTAYAPVGASRSAWATDAHLTADGDHMLFQPTGPKPAVHSPDFHVGQGRNYPAIRFRVRAPKGAVWRCAISFDTGGPAPTTARVDVDEPSWSTGPAEVTVDLSGNNDWMSGDVRRVSIELGQPGDGAYEMHGRLELIPSPARAEALARIVGLPQESQWAADWQQALASEHGIDALFMCTYWDGEKSLTAAVTRAMFSSKAAPTLKLGLYFDNLAARRPQTLAEFDELLRYWNHYFASDKCWRIDGRPVVGWHGGEATRDFLSAVPEFKAMTAAARLAAMVRYIQNFYRQTSGSHASSGLYLVSGFMPDHPYWTGSVEGHGALWEQAGFDAGTVYNQFRSFTDQRQHSTRDASGIVLANGTASTSFPQGGAQNFNEMREVYRRAADWIINQSGSRLAYFMPASAGWDVRPWLNLSPRHDPPCAPTWGCTPDRTQFQLHLEEVRGRTIKSAAQIRTPVGPVVMINAWDEFAEGGILCPTRSYGMSRLQAIRDVFGTVPS